MSIKHAPVPSPEVIEYTPLHLPQHYKDNETSRQKLKNSILLQVQGDPVEIKDNTDIPTLMFAFDAIRTVCPEAIFRFTTGEQILIFNHQAKDVLRPDGIIEGFTDFNWKEVDGEKRKKLVLNLDTIWKKTSGHGLLERIKLTLESVNDELEKADKIILLGNFQPLIVLFAQYKCYEFADEIYYQKNNDSEPIRIN